MSIGNSIFILSQHRTGSTLLRNILDSNSNVTMAFDEMNLYEPMRKNTLDRLLDQGVESAGLIAAIKKRQVYGTFWQEFANSGIDIALFSSEIKKHFPLNPMNVIGAVLACISMTSDAQYVGAKYPVHFSRVSLLREWFPESKIIVLFRNPKAMIASKLNDGATRARKQKSRLHHFAIHYFTLLFFSLEFVRSVAVYQKHRNEVLKVNYEALVLNQHSVIEELCRYCGIEFEPEMLSVSGKKSSYQISERNQVSAASLDKYHQVLGRFDQWLIDAITLRSYRKVQ